MNSFLRHAEPIIAAHLEPAVRSKWREFLRFDNELSSILAKASEPITAQLRLAWWRDEFGKLALERTPSVPLLDALGTNFHSEISNLSDLVDGYEALALNEVDEGSSGVYAVSSGRKAALIAVCGMSNAAPEASPLEALASSWTFAEYLRSDAHVSVLDEARSIADRPRPTFPRSLRGLAILDRLACRSIRRGGSPLMTTRGDAAAAMRIGLLGR